MATAAALLRDQSDRMRLAVAADIATAERRRGPGAGMATAVGFYDAATAVGYGPSGGPVGRMILTNVRLTAGEHQAATHRALELGVSLAALPRRPLLQVLTPMEAHAARPSYGSQNPGSGACAPPHRAASLAGGHLCQAGGARPHRRHLEGAERLAR